MGGAPVLKSPAQIELMRRAGHIVAVCLQKIEQAAQPGITGEELDALADSTIRRMGGKPSFKGYGGFPASICLSFNDEVVHGIPGTRRVKDGDLLSVDIGAKLAGYHADGAASFVVGKPSATAQRLLAVTKAALFLGVEQARAGNRVVDISRAVQTYVEKAGYSVVRDLVGHGVGRELHEAPQVPHFVVSGQSPLLKVGMTVAIEPMVNAGGWRVRRDADGWTHRTADGSLSAHFEHTVAITEEGPVILTREDAGDAPGIDLDHGPGGTG